MEHFVNTQFSSKILLSNQVQARHLQLETNAIPEWFCAQTALKYSQIICPLLWSIHFGCSLCKIEHAEFPSMDLYSNPAEISYSRHESFFKSTYFIFPLLYSPTSSEMCLQLYPGNRACPPFQHFIAGLYWVSNSIFFSQNSLNRFMR